MLGKCDPYVTLSFFEQKFNTAVHRNCLDSTFDEIFIVFVHGNNAALAKNEVKYEEFQKAVSCISLQISCIVTLSPLRMESPLLKIYLLLASWRCCTPAETQFSKVSSRMHLLWEETLAFGLGFENLCAG